MFRKFFDTAAPAENVSTNAGGEPVSVATLMATKGVVNKTENPVATPISTEKKEETAPASASTNAATASQTQPAETVTNPPKPNESGSTQKEETKQISWQEVLKNQQPDTILKELGFDEKTVGFLKGRKGIDEKMLNFFNHWETNNGDVSRYLRELTTDYSKMPSEEVMRNQLRQEYPKATDKQIDALFKKQVLDYYKVDPNLYSEDEVAEGRLLLDAIADKHRDKFIEDQQQFMMPKPPTKEEGPDLELEEAKSLYNSYSKTISETQQIKDLLGQKSLVFGEGDEKFKFPIPFADQIVDDIMNTLAINIAEGRTTKDNIANITPEVIQNEIMTRAFSKNPKAFITALADHFKTIGGKKIIESMENAKVPTTEQAAKAEATTTSAAAAMAKGGRIVSGGSY